MIEGLLRIPLRRFEDERGWFAEIRRESLLPKQTRQTNLSFSRKGVLRGLHYHERGQDDLFVCLQGTARVVVLDRESGETFTEDIGDDNPVALYIPGRHAHGFEALTDLFFCYHVTEEYDPADPGRAGDLLGRSARQAPLEHGHTAPLRAGSAGVYLVTGAGGQLGRALAEEFAEDGVVALSRADWDVELPLPAGLEQPDVVLHAAAWTNVDGAEDDPQGAAAVNVGGTANVAALGAPLVYYSTDYVFDGSKREPYVESDGPNPQSAYGRTKLHGEAAAGERAWIVRSSWLFGPTGTNFVRTMLRLGEERDEVAVVDDQRGLADVRRPPRRGDAPGPAPAPRRLPRRRRGRRDVGRLRRGDLRGGRPRHPRAADHDRGARPPGAAAGVLGAPQREGRADAAALARGAARDDRRHPGRAPPPNRAAWRATPS